MVVEVDKKAISYWLFFESTSQQDNKSTSKAIRMVTHRLVDSNNRILVDLPLPLEGVRGLLVDL